MCNSHQFTFRNTFIENHTFITIGNSKLGLIKHAPHIDD